MDFCFVQNFFFRQHKSQNIYFFCREFFFQNSTLGYMTKTLNQIIFLSSTKIRILFSATKLGVRIFFQKKTITPPFKLNGRSLKITSLVRYDLNLALGCHRFYYLAPFMVFDSFSHPFLPCQCLFTVCVVWRINLRTASQDQNAT